MILSKGGITLDNIASMTDKERLTWSIVLGESQGSELDWDLAKRTGEFRFYEKGG